MTLVSVLHTSVAAFAQPMLAQQAPATGRTPQAAPAEASAPAPSSADADVRERARTAYAAGKAAYAAQDYTAAAQRFAEADAVVPAIQAKYWRAMSLDQLGDVAGALSAFELVLAQPDKDQLGAEALANAQARQSALAAMPADLTLTTSPPGARVRVSGVDVASLTPLSLRLAPGRHVVEVSLDGYETQQIEIAARPGEKLEPSLTLAPVTAPASDLSAPPLEPVAPASPPPERSRVPGWVTLGVAGASAVVGTIFGIRALGNKDDFDKNPSTEAADDVERDALIADMAFGVTLTLGITGIVLLVADDPTPEQAAAPKPERAQLRVLPYASPSGAGAAATLSF